MTHGRLQTKLTAGFMIALALIIACVLNPGSSQAEQKAVCATAAADYSSGAFSVISVDPVGGPRAIQNDINPTISDISVSAFGPYFYIIERLTGENITKYDINNPSTRIWQYSVTDETDAVSSVNPHSIVFAGPTKAYVLRHNSSIAWIINPETKQEADFKIGTLDLSAYNDQDEMGPEMTTGVIVGNKLFIVMQRLNQNDNWVPNESYVAVFDTATDQEITTGMHATLKGIPLPVKNPSAIMYESVSNRIYIQAQGKLESSWSGTPAEYSGGIVAINPDTYETTLVLDDGDEASHPYGNISGMTILSDQKGYFVSYAGWGDNTLYEFNPSTGAVAGVVHEWLENKNIAGMDAGGGIDENGLLWVTNCTDAEIVIIDPEDNTMDETCSTNLNPQKIVFTSGDILQASVNGNDLVLNCFFREDISNYTLLYAFPPLTGESEIFYMDLGDQTQLSLPGLPGGFSCFTAIQATTTDGNILLSNIETINIP